MVSKDFIGLGFILFNFDTESMRILNNIALYDNITNKGLYLQYAY